MDVAAIQRALYARGYDPGPLDGVMGSKTGEAARAFQRAAGLAADGVVGARTAAALAAGPSKPEPAGTSLSPIGAAALIAREGRRLKAYRDSVGVWTIGVGHTSAAGPPVVRPGLTIGVEECDALFARDVARFERTVREALLAESLPPHAFDALVSLCFNIGPAAFLRSSVLRRLRAGDRQGAAEAILMWDRPAEVVPRRQGEYDQFRTPYETALPRARRGDARAVSRRRRRAARLPPPPLPPPEPAPPEPAPPPAPSPSPSPARIGWLARLRGHLWPR